jgi:hypothetical protein
LVIQSTYTNFILIIHGQPDGSGLFLPLFRNSSKQDTFHYDLQKLMDVDANVSTMSEANFSVMGLGPLDTHTKASLKRHNREDPRQARVEKMLDLMHQVRNKKSTPSSSGPAISARTFSHYKDFGSSLERVWPERLIFTPSLVNRTPGWGKTFSTFI